MFIRKMFAWLAAAVAVLSAVFAAGVTSARATDATEAAIYNCDRQCLKQICDLYFDALAKHDPSLLPLSPDVKYAETGRFIKLGEGIWKNAGQATYRMELFDPQTGGIGVEAVLPDGGVPTVMALRLKIKNHLITEVESIIIHKGDKATFGAPEKLVQPSLHFTRKIRPAEQNSRYELVAAADAYFRAFETEGTPDYIRAPLLPDTLRFENGIRTTNAALGNFPATTAAEQFDTALFKGAKICDRRYPVVDTEIGAVMSWVRFATSNLNGPPPPNGGERYGDTFVAETFAIAQGKIVEIQAAFIPTKEELPTPSF
jgi:hypothetical protein